ncbi:MAG: hypothetical protein JRF49_07330 [Deltaproteobacteria bacterium]|nr:hypothetical protein [Deltaproteobacteria bacterium]
MERIVVVDDEAEVCDALKEFLSSRDYEVETALDGQTALKKVEDFKKRWKISNLMLCSSIS